MDIQVQGAFDVTLLRGCTSDGIAAEAAHRGYLDGVRGIDRSDLLPDMIRDSYIRANERGQSKVPTR